MHIINHGPKIMCFERVPSLQDIFGAESELYRLLLDNFMKKAKGEQQGVGSKTKVDRLLLMTLSKTYFG